MTNLERHQHTMRIALALAPALQRYDFSDKNHPKAWAEQSVECAKAFMALDEAGAKEAQAKDKEAKS